MRHQDDLLPGESGQSEPGESEELEQSEDLGRPDVSAERHGPRELRSPRAEREKELSYLHHAARLLEVRGEPRDIVRAALELLPSAFCEPELAAARLRFGSLELATRDYVGTEPALRARFEVAGEGAGELEVCYREPPPSSEAFLEEERALLDSAALLFKSYFERLRGEAAYQRLVRAEAAEQSAASESRAREALMGMAAHELRSSLHVMLGWVQILQRGAAPDVAARGLRIMERNVSLQTKLIDDLLDLSRIATGKLALEPIELDLTELVAFAVDATRPAASDKQIAVTAALEPVGRVLADQQRLQQVVYNLLGNAVKFTPSGGRIDVRLSRQGSLARLEVADTGIGISPELLPHLFEPFRQADTASRGRSGGLGLGLPIARHLVELHGGTIAARSAAPAPGTTLEITLPLTPAGA